MDIERFLGIMRTNRNKNEFKEKYIALNEEIKYNSMDIETKNDANCADSFNYKGHNFSLRTQNNRKKRKLKECIKDIDEYSKQVDDKDI